MAETNPCINWNGGSLLQLSKEADSQQEVECFQTQDRELGSIANQLTSRDQVLHHCLQAKLRKKLILVHFCSNKQLTGYKIRCRGKEIATQPLPLVNSKYKK